VGVEGDTIHWSDWASQPEIRIACSRGYHLPWTKRKDLPPHVHEVPVRDLPSILYTFNVRLVTCEACRDLATFKKAHKIATDYDRRLAASGLSEEEFVAQLKAEMLEALDAKG
jgi:hypothetical protein